MHFLYIFCDLFFLLKCWGYAPMHFFFFFNVIYFYLFLFLA